MRYPAAHRYAGQPARKAAGEEHAHRDGSTLVLAFSLIGRLDAEGEAPLMQLVSAAVVG